MKNDHKGFIKLVCIVFHSNSHSDPVWNTKKLWQKILFNRLSFAIGNRGLIGIKANIMIEAFVILPMSGPRII